MNKPMTDAEIIEDLRTECAAHDALLTSLLITIKPMAGQVFAIAEMTAGQLGGAGAAKLVDRLQHMRRAVIGNEPLPELPISPEALTLIRANLAGQKHN